MKKRWFVLKTEFCRGFWNKGFFLAEIGMIAGIIHGVKSSGMLTGDVHSTGIFFQCMQRSLCSETMVFLLPILMCLPYSAIFVDEYLNGYLKIYLSRIEKKNYILAKEIIALLMPMLLSVLAILIAGISIKVLFFHDVEICEKMELYRFLQYCTACVIASVIWGCLGNVYGIYFKNRHMAYAGTFVTNYIWIIIFSRYFQRFPFANPRNWYSGNYLGYMGVLLLLIVVIEWMILKREIDVV